MAALDGLGGAVGGILKFFLIGLAVLVVVGLAIWLIVFLYRRKKWNLTIGVKLPRAGGGLLIGEIAKGRYDAVAGIVDIKRKGVSSIGMKPFDVKQYLQGERYLEVLQLSPTDYIPIDPASYKVVTGEGGKEHAVIGIKTDLLKRKTWRNYMERAAKGRFTLAGFLETHWRAIELSIIIFIIFVGFSAMWMRLPSICTA